jgi:fumarate reductase flavoprotein subunit
LNTGNICISDSWDEIALFVGADPSVLKATIDEYNTGCDRGRDDAFFKDPFYLRPLCQAPYYAIKGELVFLNTMGGLKINEFMEVIDTKGSAIKGLYAAGADTGDWEPDTYCDNLSGTAFGFAVNSGRIAAENAVKYISQK